MTLRQALGTLVLLAVAGVAQAATHAVTIENMQSRPAILTVKAGDVVTWTNKDVVPHTATAPGHFDSKQIDPGKRWSWTANAKGRIDYVCTYHPGMHATVVVE